jgi:hypothetical protein
MVYQNMAEEMHVTRLFPLLLAAVLAAPLQAQAGKGTRLGVGTSFSLGASIPKGELWSVDPRATVGFSLSVGLRVLFGHSVTEPTLFFVPNIIDTRKKGGSNGSYLSGLLGMQIYPYNVLFVQPYMMFGFGFGWVGYEGPSTDYPTLPEQKGSGMGIPILVGGGIDFNLYKWFSIGPTFFWNPAWWADCKIDDIYLVSGFMCDPKEDRWILKFWFAGLRLSFNFDRK